MGVRFRKSIKIMPGVRINVSKSGLSTTIGPKGASVSVGKKGVYANTGIPGTGIYAREKIAGPKSSAHQTRSTTKSYDPEFLRLYEIYKPITIKITSSGKINILDKNNDIITDEYFLKKMRATDDFKAQKEQLVSQWREKSEQEYQQSHEAISSLINIHQYSFPVKPLSEYEKYLASIKKQEYQKQAFSDKEPTRQEIEASLISYADTHVTTKAFWRVKKLRAQYVQDNLDGQYQKQHSEWEKKKSDFDDKQQKIADLQNVKFEKEYEGACNDAKAAIAGSEEYVKEHLESWLTNCTLPVEINVDYEYEADTGNMYIDIILPQETVIPNQEIIRLANGGVKEKNKTKQKIQEEYARLIFGLGICITSGVFDISPAIKRILASGFISNNEENEKEEACLYSIKYDRKSFEDSQLQAINPLEFINNFENRYKASQTWVFKPVTPFDDF